MFVIRKEFSWEFVVSGRQSNNAAPINYYLELLAFFNFVIMFWKYSKFINLLRLFLLQAGVLYSLHNLTQDPESATSKIHGYRFKHVP